MDNAQLEAQIQARGLNAPRVSNAHIDALMARVEYHTVSRPGGSTSTFVHAFLDGKFMLATGHSACVSAANFDPVIGEALARQNAETAARSKLWELEGYLLYVMNQAHTGDTP